MFKINHHKNNHSVEIKSETHGVYAHLHLNEGASLQQLTLNHIPLIADLEPLTYKSTYASAILFPFANRIEDGTYKFERKTYQLQTNNKDENNALHGLVYNKTFSIKTQSANEDSAQVVVDYDYNEPEPGFPFPFSIQITYRFTRDRLDLEVVVKNNSEVTFPFTIGWHPYFISENLDKSDLKFKSHLKLKHGDRNIGLNLQEIKPTNNLNLKAITLDDCWKLNNSDVTFETPKYKLDIMASESNSFLQVYTPPKKNTIAIEPTTGVSNSFNNSIGLKVLEPKAAYKITWNLKVHSN